MSRFTRARPRLHQRDEAPRRDGTVSRPWLERCRGEPARQLLEMSASYSIPSILVAFEDALLVKAARSGLASLNEAEITVLAVEVVERYVNDGGFRALFAHAAAIVPHAGAAFRRIGCSGLAEIIDRAIEIRDGEGSLEPSDFYSEPVSARAVDPEASRSRMR